MVSVKIELGTRQLQSGWLEQVHAGPCRTILHSRERHPLLWAGAGAPGLASRDCLDVSLISFLSRALLLGGMSPSQVRSNESERECGNIIFGTW